MMGDYHGKDYADLTVAVTRAGAEHGTASGSWVVDGNTTDESKRTILTMIEDGDPAWEIPAPLSGEWADSPTPDSVRSDLDAEAVPDEVWDDMLTLYEDAYYRAYEDEVVRSIKATL